MSFCHTVVPKWGDGFDKGSLGDDESTSMTTLLECSEMFLSKKIDSTKVSSSYHLCVECFSQLSFDSEVYTKSATAADFVYTFE